MPSVSHGLQNWQQYRCVVRHLAGSRLTLHPSTAAGDHGGTAVAMICAHAGGGGPRRAEGAQHISRLCPPCERALVELEQTAGAARGVVVGLGADVDRTLAASVRASAFTIRRCLLSTCYQRVTRFLHLSSSHRRHSMSLLTLRRQPLLLHELCHSAAATGSYFPTNSTPTRTCYMWTTCMMRDGGLLVALPAQTPRISTCLGCRWMRGKCCSNCKPGLQGWRQRSSGHVVRSPTSCSGRKTRFSRWVRLARQPDVVYS